MSLHKPFLLICSGLIWLVAVSLLVAPSSLVFFFSPSADLLLLLSCFFSEEEESIAASIAAAKVILLYQESDSLWLLNLLRNDERCGNWFGLFASDEENVTSHDNRVAG